jgi:hypothetical protein
LGYLITFQTDGPDIEIIGWNGPITETREIARKVELSLGAVVFRITDLTSGEEEYMEQRPFAHDDGVRFRSMKTSRRPPGAG